MATNYGSLAQELADAGLSPNLAKLIANAIANASTPQFTIGSDKVDATPAAKMRLITADTRRYELTNLDYSPQAPFEERIAATPNAYQQSLADHPYKDAQPVNVSPSLAQPSVVGSDYIDVTQSVEGNTAVSTVSLNLRAVQGQHLRLDAPTKTLDSVALQAVSITPKYLSAAVNEAPSATEVQVGVRAVEEVVVVLADGTTRKMVAWPAEAAQAMSVAARDSLAAALATPRAFVNFRGNDDSPSAYTAATYGRAGTTVTITLNSHGYRPGHRVYCDFTSGGALDGEYSVTTASQNTFTITTVASGTIAAGSAVTLRTLTIRSSFNVHSVHHMGTGDYHVNFLKSLPDNNYCAVGTCTARGGDPIIVDNVCLGYGSSTTTATNGTYDSDGLRVIAQRAAGGRLNQQTVSLAIFR